MNIIIHDMPSKIGSPDILMHKITQTEQMCSSMSMHLQHFDSNK